MKKLLAVLFCLVLLPSTFCAMAEDAPTPIATTPESVTVTYDGSDYNVQVLEIGLNEEGNRTVSIPGTGGIMHMRNSQMIAHIQMEIVANGETFGWQNANFGDQLITFHFATDLYPEKVLVYSYDDPTRKEMVLPAQDDATDASASIPEELIGTWAGKGDYDIDLTFTVAADGTGSYTFLQDGYEESYDFVLESDSSTFSLTVPKDNKLGISVCDGSYAYADGKLTLDVSTKFQNGRKFEYSIVCEKVEK